MVKLYISGPISGDPEYKGKFGVMARQLEGWGYTVLNPAGLPGGMSKADYMRICLSMVDTADALVAMRGWLDSASARIEVSYARYIGRPVIMGACADDELRERLQESIKQWRRKT